MKHLLVDRRSRPRRRSRSCSTSPSTFLEVTQRDIPKVPALRGKIVVSLFYEDSTRTRLSFETAAKRLSGDVMTFSVGASSVQEGREPARHGADDRGDGHRRDRRAPPGAPARRTASPAGSTPRVINAGDGRHEHPTQALLDAFTLRRHRGPSLDGVPRRDRRRHPPLAGRPQRRAGASPRSAPTSRSSGRRRCCPSRSTAGRSRSSHDLDDVLAEVDVVYLLRIQRERASARRCSRPCASTPRATGSPPSAAARLQARHARHAPGPDEPRRRDRGRGRRRARVARHRAGRQRRRGAHGRAVRRCSGREARLSERPAVRAHPRRTGASTRPASASPTCWSRDGAIVEVGPGSTSRGRRSVLDAEGCVVAPGLVDLQVHFREPGTEEAETIETGARAAALGGFTAVVCDAEHRRRRSTTPRSSRRSSAAGERAVVRRCVSPGCITKGRAGDAARADGRAATTLGVRIFTDDGDCVADASVMRRALEYAPALPGRGDRAARRGRRPRRAAGTCTKGEWSSRLGIPGRPAGGGVVDRRPRPRARRAHRRPRTTSCTCSTAGAVELVRAAKAAGSRSPPRRRRTTSRSPTRRARASTRCSR